MFTTYEIHLVLVALASAAHKSRWEGHVEQADKFWALRQKVADLRDKEEEEAAKREEAHEEVAHKLFLTTRPMI